MGRKNSGTARKEVLANIAKGIVIFAMLDTYRERFMQMSLKRIDIHGIDETFLVKK